MKIIPLLLLLGAAAQAQTPSNAAASGPDVLIFADGEKLIGHLVRSTGNKVTFKSDVAGEITVNWNKVKELHSAQKFAVIGKDIHLGRRPNPAGIPQGEIAVAEGKLEVRASGAALRTLPIADTAQVIDEPDFQKALENPGLLHDWKGRVIGGVALVEATQKSETFSGGFNLIRAVPGQDWLAPRNRTLIDFNAAYGKLTQPNTPEVMTEIFHANLERDEYLDPRIFVFGQTSFDHNFSQGLDLQQNYGGGFGWTIVRNDDQELDVKSSATYIRQGFQDSSKNQDLIGTTFGEIYNRKFRHGILLAQQLTFIPAWNNTSAYSGVGNANLTIPFYKRLNFGLGAVDNFLNDPPPGFRKNSFQFTTGVTYTLH